MKRLLHEKYAPQYFLSALGFGGVAVSFFMYLMFLTSHASTPIPIFETIVSSFAHGNIFLQAMIIVSMVAIIGFSAMHLFLMYWNFSEFSLFTKTNAYHELKKTNGEVSLLAPYLALGMTINVLFIVGAVFVPGLWSVVEYLFPMAIVAFFVVGILALKTFGDYIGRIIAHGFDFDKNNNMNQLMSAMTFAMISVGLAASAAMSHHPTTVAIALMLSVFFGVITSFLAIFWGTISLKSILKKGINEDTAASLWVMVPIFTLMGIATIRNLHGVHTLSPSDHQGGSITLFLLTTVIFSFEIFLLYIGYKAFTRIKFFENYIHGDKRTPQVFSIICPGVAFVVFGFFFIHLGLVQNHIIDKFSVVYFLLLSVLVLAQAKTIQTLLIISKKNLTK